MEIYSLTARLVTKISRKIVSRVTMILWFYIGKVTENSITLLLTYFNFATSIMIPNFFNFTHANKQP